MRFSNFVLHFRFSGSTASSIHHLVPNEQPLAINEVINTTDDLDIDEVVFTGTMGPPLSKRRSPSNTTIQSIGKAVALNNFPKTYNKRFKVIELLDVF